MPVGDEPTAGSESKKKAICIDLTSDSEDETPAVVKKSNSISSKPDSTAKNSGKNSESIMFGKCVMNNLSRMKVRLYKSIFLRVQCCWWGYGSCIVGVAILYGSCTHTNSQFSQQVELTACC